MKCYESCDELPNFCPNLCSSDLKGKKVVDNFNGAIKENSIISESEASKSEFNLVS